MRKNHAGLQQFTLIVFALAVLTLGVGCAHRVAPLSFDTPPKVAAFDGRHGAGLHPADLPAMARAAEALILGEMHGHAPTHAFQRWLMCAVWREDASIPLALEKLARDKQPALDDYLAGHIDREAWLNAVGARGPAWERDYQPLVDLARRHGAPVIAANAPRRLASLARTDGFDALDALPPAERALVARPGPIDEAAYRARFTEAMAAHPAPEGAPALDLDAFFRAQQVWDATMAASVAEAVAAHGRAILIVGQFHSDHEGGLTRRLRAALPEARVVTWSMRRGSPPARQPEDRGRADVVIYLGDADV